MQTLHYAIAKKDGIYILLLDYNNNKKWGVLAKEKKFADIIKSISNHSGHVLGEFENADQNSLVVSASG